MFEDTPKSHASGVAPVQTLTFAVPVAHSMVVIGSLQRWSLRWAKPGFS